MHRPLFLVLSVAIAAACQGTAASPQKAPAQQGTGAAPKGVDQSPALAAVVVEAGENEYRFRVELARTPQERSRGLMFREHMDDDAGMLFLFDRMEVQSFWMKNTRIPLDMLFLDEAGAIVGIVENAEPLTLTSRSVGLPSRYVLELVGGTCRRLGIEAGQRARFIDVPGHPAARAR